MHRKKIITKPHKIKEKYLGSQGKQWRSNELLKYLVFIIKYKKNMEQAENKKTGIFIKMA